MSRNTKSKKHVITETIIAALFGIGIGSLLSWFFSGIASGFTYYSAVTPEYLQKNPNYSMATLVSFILCAIFGIVSYWVSYLFELATDDKVSLLLATVVNFAANFLVFIVIGLYLCWFSGLSALYATISFGVTFFVIWSIKYFAEKSKLDKFNKEISNR